jgi:hypothetical protein
MGVELQSETRIVVGRLCAPSDPERPWWWETSTTVDDKDVTIAGLARSESDAILAAAGSSLQIRLAAQR